MMTVVRVGHASPRVDAAHVGPSKAALGWSEADADRKPKQTCVLFACRSHVQGNVVSPGVNELVIPNYKQTWAGIRKLADAPEGIRHLSFKSEEYASG